MVVKVQPIVTTNTHLIKCMNNNEYLCEDNCDEAIGLLMTYRCNLSCKYCYIQKKQPLDFNLETAQVILEQFLNKDEGKVDITFMGGETLLAYKLIVQLIEWVQSKKWKRKYRFFGSTNGTLLTDDMKPWLLAHRSIFTLALSYDGLPETQTDNRGNDSIDTDFFIKTWPFQPIQMTINAESVNKMADGVIYLLEKGARVHPNVAFEETDWSDEHILEYGRQLHRLAIYYNSHPDLPTITQFSHDLSEYADNIDNPKIQKEICGAGNGFQVFDVDGSSYPCHILSPLVLSGEKLNVIKDGLLSQTSDFSDERCSKCPYNTACPTCMACNFLYRGQLQKRDWTHCQVMQMEVKAFIKKEVLRLTAKMELTPEDATEIDAICKITEYEKRIS